MNLEWKQFSRHDFESFFRISGIFTSDQKSQVLKSDTWYSGMFLKCIFMTSKSTDIGSVTNRSKLSVEKHEKVKNRFWTEFWKMIRAFQRLITKNQNHWHLKKWRSKMTYGYQVGMFFWEPSKNTFQNEIDRNISSEFYSLIKKSREVKNPEQSFWDMLKI